MGAPSGGELSGKLTVTEVLSLAALWFVPRLGSFIKAFPDIQIQILVARVARDLNLGKADMRIA